MQRLPILLVLFAFPLALTACTSDDAPVVTGAPAANEVPAGDEHTGIDDDHMDDDHMDDDHIETGDEHMDNAPMSMDGGQMEDAPHGGTVKEAGDGHLELVVSGRAFMVYPLDDMAAPMPATGIEGARVVLHPQSGDEQTLPLALMGDHLMATVPARMTAYTADVSVPVAGETREARFEVGLDGDSNHAH